MKVSTNKPISKKTKLLLSLFVIVVAIFIMLICFGIDSSDANFESDRFGAFSKEDFPITVEESPIAKTKFHLSDKTITESKNEKEIVPIRMYQQGYGTYPIITTELDATRLTTAFAMLILDMDYDTDKVFTSEDKTIMPYLVNYNVGRAITFNVEKDVDNKLCQTKLICDNVSADLSIVSDGLTELIKWSENMQKDIVYNLFATDAIVVFTSVENPVDSITQEQLKAIYNE